MPQDKLILDIRYFESDVPNVDNTHPDEVGEILTLSKSSALVGARIARKLRELGFKTGEFHHVYINFTTVLPDGDIAFSTSPVDKGHPWYRFIDMGVNRKTVNSMSSNQQMKWLETATLKVTSFLAGQNKQQLALVENVRELLKTHGKDLPILHKTKETTKDFVTIFYRIASKIDQSTAWVEYINKKTGERRRGCFAKLELYEDIYFLVSGISVSKGIIILKPRSSATAALYCQRYETPITIDIQDLPLA